MDGAVGFDASILQGKRLLNIDSEEEGILTVSCAGGAHAKVNIAMTAEACTLDTAEIKISGLKGGHSGAEIDKGRANATITLGRVLQALVDKLEVRLVSAEGGLKDNAIPNAARAVIALEDGKLPRAQEICAELQDTFRREYAAADPDVTVTFTPGTVASQALTLRDTKKVCCFLGLYPNGIESMSMDIPGLVQTSCNLRHFQGQRLGSRGLRLRPKLDCKPQAAAARRIGLLARRARRHAVRFGGIPRVGIPPRVSPARRDVQSLQGPVRAGHEGRGNPRRSRVRSVLRQDSGARCRLLWSQSL